MKLTFNRTFFIRLTAIVLVILLAVWMFFIGKQHTILLDNKTVGDFKALSEVEVQVDKQEALFLMPRDRDQAIVTAQKHKVVIKYTDSSWNEVEIVKTVKLPLMDSMMLLSIPTLVANPEAEQSEWLTHFEIQVTPPEKDEVVITDEVTLVTDI
ncbi:MAG: hypothetical protein GX903_02370 [Spirochaetales bacterium]|nr:hypothetical protein [Spirochaetales bacterium]